MTMDNGKEFVGHVAYRLSGFQTFFCDPYRPRQKALVEKMNSLLHRILPKNTDITTVTQRGLDNVAEIFNNNMPRKIFGYKTPNEIWAENLGFVLLNPCICTLNTLFYEISRIIM